MKLFFRYIPLLIFIYFFASIYSNILAQNGNKIEIAEISFEGNEQISSAELESIIVLKESPGWFSQFLNKYIGFGEEAVYFDSLQIPADLNAISAFYFDHGYFEAEVDFRYEIDRDDDEARITYIIKENDVSTISSFNVTGIEDIHTEFQDYIRELTDQDTTQIYSKAIVENINNEIVSYLRNRGLMLVTTDLPFVEIDTINNKVDIQLNVVPGKRYKINDVRVSKSGPGKELVSSQLIKDIVGVKPEQYYNYYNLQRGQTRLYRTNLFSSVVVSGITADTIGNYVPINISTDVGLLNEFSPEIIVNNEDNQFNLGLSFSYARKNFFGDARKFTIKTSAASQNIIEFLSNPRINDTTVIGYADLRTIFEQPFLFGQPIYTKLENYVTHQKRKNEYNATLFGSKLSFDFELPPKVYFTGLSTYINWEKSKYFYQVGFLTKVLTNYAKSQGINSPEADSIGAYLAGFFPRNSEATSAIIGVDAIANKTDNYLFPTRGYSIGLSIGDGNGFSYLLTKAIGNPIESPLYYKVLLTTTAYIPAYFSRESSLGVKFLIGNIHTYRGDRDEIPLTQRFNSGGSNSIRGWQARELAPEESDVAITSLSASDLESFAIENSIGGFFIMEGSIETRNRLIGRLGSAFFVDYGNTFNTYKKFRLDKLAVAVGFGLRYYSDIVPIRIDFGFKFYDPDDPRSFFTKFSDSDFFGKHVNFHIGIGEAF